ncbi:MAG TPA: S1 RNA-binding domain-containing protein, partial [Chloroflexaceae bacterium]|nr:S1 RNA-binding domain-containing protein [Chloroflexaceae bacterium]
VPVAEVAAAAAPAARLGLVLPPAEGEDQAEAPAQAEAAGASFTPVAEEGSRPRKLKDLQPGMELEGRVTSIALYGVFVDIGVGRDGLVHISEMSDTRIDTPSDIVQIGDTVKVRIKSVDPDARRISLTMRSGSGEKERGESRRGRPKRAEVDKDRLASMRVGDVVEGVITGYASFGAFADIGVGKDGLIHVSELAEGRVEKAEDAVKVGDRFQFKVLEVDPEGTRISLSLRRAQRTQKMQGLEPGQVIEGTVSGIAPFGAFVDIGVGRDGLVHISALSTSRVNRVEDVVKVGDKVTVRVIEVDQQSKRISLTMRLDDEGGAEDDEDYTSGAGAAPRPSPAAAARFASAAEARAGRDRDRERRERRERDRGRNTPQTVETYSTEDVEEEFVGDATLEDLLTKFGGPSAKRDRKGGKREEGDFEEEGEGRQDRRQRDAIKRTLQQVGRDE